MKWKRCECPDGRMGESEREERKEKRDGQRENKEGHVSVEGSVGSALPSCRRGRKS